MGLSPTLGSFSLSKSATALDPGGGRALNRMTTHATQLRGPAAAPQSKGQRWARESLKKALATHRPYEGFLQRSILPKFFQYVPSAQCSLLGGSSQGHLVLGCSRGHSKWHRWLRQQVFHPVPEVGSLRPLASRWPLSMHTSQVSVCVPECPCCVAAPGKT